MKNNIIITFPVLLPTPIRKPPFESNSKAVTSCKISTYTKRTVSDNVKREKLTDTIILDSWESTMFPSHHISRKLNKNNV